MPEHSNVDLIRRGYEAFGRGDMATVDSIFADDIVWHNLGRNQLSGTLTSKQDVFDFFRKLAELSDGSFRIELHDVVGNDEHVVVLSSAHGSRQGRTLEMQSADVWHVRDGRAVEFWHVPTDTYSEDDFWQ